MLLKGGRGNHSRFGWSYNVGDDSKKMQTCPKCLKDLKEAFRRGGQKCPLVMNATTFGQKMLQSPPEDFPMEEIDNQNKMIRCFCLIFQKLQKAVDKAHEKSFPMIEIRKQQWLT